MNPEDTREGSSAKALIFDIPTLTGFKSDSLGGGAALPHAAVCRSTTVGGRLGPVLSLSLSLSLL